MFKCFKIAFFGSSLLSSYWNGAATYYRGILSALARRGHQVTFFEPDAWNRQNHCDITPPPWAQVNVFEPTEKGATEALERAAQADFVVKASGVGVLDPFLEEQVLTLQESRRQVVFWDVDAPATLERLSENPGEPFHPLVSRYDAIFTYGGGPRVVGGYRQRGAQTVCPIYNAMDPSTHFPTTAENLVRADLAFLANRLPDRDKRADEFFFSVAERLPEKSFLLGGSGWEGKPVPENVRWIDHVPTRLHNSFNASALAVLNVNRESMARFGFSPPTRVFECAGAAACLITDQWEGIDTFLEPGKEVLVAGDGEAVASHLMQLTLGRAREIGQAARSRCLAEHTYDHRAEQVQAILDGAQWRGVA